MAPLIDQQIDQLQNTGDVIRVKRYDGGLNSTASNSILQDNEAIIRKNWDTDNVGAIVKVNGITKRNSSAIASAPILGLFRVYQSDGTTKLLAVCNGILYYSDNEGTSWTAATSGTGLSTSKFNSGVNYNDLFFFTNVTDNLQTFTVGTNTMAAATDQPTDPCRILLKRADRRLLALVNTVNGSTLYASKLDPTGAAADDWSAANDYSFIAIDGAKSEPLTGGMTFGAVDIIFKAYSAFKVWGYPRPQAIRMPGAPGCVAPQSVAQGEGLGFHLSHNAVWMWDGNKFIKISDPINDTIAKIRKGYKTQSFGIYRDGKYRLYYTKDGDTVNKSCLIYDVYHSNPYNGRNIWYEREGIEINCPVVFSGEGDDNELFGGDSASTGFVYKMDFSSTGADVTAKINAIYQTKYFDGGYSHLTKRFRKIRVRYYSAKGTLLFNWYTDRGLNSKNYDVAISTTGAKLGSFVLGTDVLSEDVEKTHTEILPDDAIGKDISIKITHDDTGVAPIIRDIEIEWEALRND